MRPTLKDVAAIAGVSPATVSRVVNARPGVRDEVRERVHAALRDLEWEPAGLRGARRARTVGLLVPELTNPVFPAFAQGVEVRLARSGMLTMLCTSGSEGMGEAAHVEELLRLGVAALVFIAGSHADLGADHAMYAELIDRGVGVVVVNGRAPDLDGVASVTCDDEEAGRIATAHLRRLGHRRIGLAAGELRFVAARRRMAGWAAELSDAGVVGDDPGGGAGPVAESGYGIAAGRRAGEALLDEGVTGVVAASDEIALGVVQAARARGLRVPEDLSVVGYDDSPLMAHVDPPLTTVRQPVDAMCRAIGRLCATAGEGEPLPAEELAFHPELIARGSTGVAPGLQPG